MNQTTRLAIFTLLAALAVSPAWADTPPGATEEKANAAALLQTFFAQVAAEATGVEVTTTTRMAAEGMKQEFSATHALSMQKPNLFAWRQVRGTPSIDIVSTSENLYTHIPAMRRYTEEPAPSSLDELAESRSIGMAEGFGAPFLTLFLAGDAREALTENPVEDLGEETIDGTVLRKLRFTSFGATYDAWMEPGPTPRLRRVHPDMSETIQEAKQDMGIDDLELSVTIDFAQWQTGTELPADTFAFAPPAGSEKVDELFEGMGEPEEQPSDALIGEAAPDFTLEQLAGGELALAAHKDKEIVILDFWATWCPPCVKALPQLIAVANDYKEKGVAFHAVNVRENNERVNAFLERHGHEMSVLMDRDGAVADLYKVTGIPQTVVIDKDGIVRKVHIGLIPNLERQLRTELDELLAVPVPEG